jgi:lipoate-protein ligase A
MILWCDGAHAPGENMRRDAVLLAALESAHADEAPGAAHAGGRRAADGPPPDEGRPEAVLRLFRFAPHGITLGRAQNPSRALDLARCRADGVPFAVRPTGGRAIFHAEEWTYSLAASIADPRWGGSLSQAYERTAELVLRSLVRLGVPAALAPPPRPAGHAARRAIADPSGAACFAATARHEIVLHGRKLVGSAQRRGARALLQQGSVLLGPGHERLAEYLAIGPEEKAAVRGALASSAAHAGDVLGFGPPLARWADALMAELPSGTRRLEGEAGVWLLTLAEGAFYTARAR